MKVRGLDGKEYSWNLSKYVGKKHFQCSELHEKTREFLYTKYPAGRILEEVYIPGENLYLDFFMPGQNLAIECQGIQHDQHNVFFHNTKQTFFAARARDRRKLEWCELNNITLLYFLPKETVEQWEFKMRMNRWTPNSKN